MHIRLVGLRGSVLGFEELVRVVDVQEQLRARNPAKGFNQMCIDRER